MGAPETRGRWRLPEWRRAFLAHGVLKGVGLTVGFSLFFVAYFHLQSSPRTEPWLVPELPWDALLPFSPWWIFPYVSLWVYVSLYPGLLGDPRALWRYSVAAVGLAAAGLIIFYLWPTRIAPPDLGPNPHAGIAFLKRVDAAGNVCPSLHVAFAVFTSCALQHLLRVRRAPALLRWANLSWATAIVLSTLGTKQHVIIDVIAGLILGLAFAWLHRPPGESRLVFAGQERRCPPAADGR